MSIFISAGEASGDHYIALLAKTLREVGCSADIWGMGGAEAQEQGVRTEWNGEELQLMGFTEILHAIPKIFKLKIRKLSYKKSLMEGLAYKWIKKDQPKLILSENYKRALSSAPSSSNPGLPRRANIFFL